MSKRMFQKIKPSNIIIDENNALIILKVYMVSHIKTKISSVDCNYEKCLQQKYSCTNKTD